MLQGPGVAQHGPYQAQGWREHGAQLFRARAAERHAQQQPWPGHGVVLGAMVHRFGHLASRGPRFSVAGMPEWGRGRYAEADAIRGSTAWRGT